MIFGLGLWDDIRHLPPFFKLCGQILISIIVYWGGVRINIISIPFMDFLHLGYMSLPVTVFWFVLVINAINLADGLDGLAAGISLFVSLTMLVICLIGGQLLIAVGFAALSGTLIAFLRYNFNPASIFMGDSGSYFLGYVLAGMSILGSIKGQVATAMLIPIIALGIPLIDTMWAPLRRFALGREVFKPDTGHLHHKLINLGYSHRRAVLIIYGFTVVLGIAAIIMIHSRDETAALVLLVVGSGVILLGHQMGLKLFVERGRLSGWLRDVSDATGITYERRSFFNHEVTILQSQDLPELWKSICDALESLEIDMAELIIYRDTADDPDRKPDLSDTGITPFGREVQSAYDWRRHERVEETWHSRESLFKIELPLVKKDNFHSRVYGTLLLFKEVEKQNPNYHMLTRIEQLRRTVNSVLEKIRSNGTQHFS